jgi:hypothetical protein
MTAICTNCNEPVPEFEHTCGACGTFYEYQNVRASREKTETDALHSRFETALASARARGIEARFEEFVAAAANSQAVVCRPLGIVQVSLSPPYTALTSYYRQVESKQRTPESNIWDRTRPAVDDMLFPYYKNDIVFGALSLNKLARLIHAEARTGLTTVA